MISRFHGALVGALIGDCLGAYFEGDMRVPINSVLQHFNAVKSKEGNGVFETMSRIDNYIFRENSRKVDEYFS